MLSLLLTSFCFSQKVINDANVEQRNVGSFEAISISGGIDVILSMGNEDAVAVSANELKHRDKIITEVKNNTLHIYYKSEKGIHITINDGNKRLRAYVSAKEIKRIEASGASDLVIEGILKTNDLAINLSGASDMKGKLDVVNLKISNSGSSDINVEGSATNANINCSGSSDVKAFGLVTENCNVSVSGSSDVNITVNNKLVANASGSSDVHYKGNASVTTNKSGSADIKKS